MQAERHHVHRQRGVIEEAGLDREPRNPERTEISCPIRKPVKGDSYPVVTVTQGCGVMQIVVIVPDKACMTHRPIDHGYHNEDGQYGNDPDLAAQSR